MVHFSPTEALDHRRAVFHAIARDIRRALGGGLRWQAGLDLIEHSDGVDTVRREVAVLDGAAHFLEAAFVGGEFHQGDRLGLAMAIGMLDEIQSGLPAEPAPEGAAYVSRDRVKHRPAMV